MRLKSKSRVSAANQRIELGQPMQHQPLELRHVRQRHALVAAQMREIAQHPAQRVAQLAIGLDGRFQDFRADALVVPIVGRASPQPQDIGARLLDHILRRHRVAERLRHFAAVLVEREAVRDHDVERRLPARAAGFQQRRLKPAAVLVGAFEIHHRLVAAVVLAADAGERRKVCRVLEHEGVRRAGIEPDVENVVDLLPALVGELAEKAFARARLVPGIGALFLEGVDDAHIDVGIVENLDRAVRLLLDEQRDRHAPGALPRDHPVGARFDHAGDALFALLRHPARRFDRPLRKLPQRQAVFAAAAQQRRWAYPSR